jgi:hypothetical protein
MVREGIKKCKRQAAKNKAEGIAAGGWETCSVSSVMQQSFVDIAGNPNC